MSLTRLTVRRATLPTTGAFRSKKEVVLDALRSAIIQGVFRPGERLVIDELAEQFGVSAIPVREALQQLQAEGFVEIQPHIGATVTRIEAGQITELFDLLAAFELISGRAACMRATTDDLAHMEALLREMDQLESDLNAWSAANVRFHQFICDCAGMPLVKSMLTRALEHWDRLRRFYLNDVFRNRVHAAQREHWQMWRAMCDRNIEQIAQVVNEHNQAARDAYTERFQQALAGDVRQCARETVP